MWSCLRGILNVLLCVCTVQSYVGGVACRGVRCNGRQESLVELGSVVTREQEENVLTENLQNLAAKPFYYIRVTNSVPEYNTHILIKSSIDPGLLNLELIAWAS